MKNKSKNELNPRNWSTKKVIDVNIIVVKRRKKEEVIRAGRADSKLSYDVLINRNLFR